MKQVCSYCQREYGTLGSNKVPIFRTFDHIVPLKRVTGLDGRKINRRGIMSKANGGNLKLHELSNLLQCCNECNRAKGCLTLIDFQNEMKKISKYKNPPLNPDKLIIVKNIINSINVLLTSESEPIKLNYLE